jgi:hypothetical protein
VTVAIARRRNSRLDWLLLRWQARLDAAWADRVVPWALAGLLFVVYFSIALARVDRLDTGSDLARAVQAAWQIGNLDSPETTVGADVNYFGLGLPLAFVPIALLTRLLPATGTILAAQSASLALGVVPIWLLARRAANLRVGAAGALVVAYALHPAVLDLSLADFHPMAMALTPLVAAAYAAERRRWRQLAVFSILAVALNAELGLVVAMLGLILVLEGERRAGTVTGLLGLAWTVASVVFVQHRLGSGFVAVGAFDAYGDSGLEVLIEMLRNPFRPLGDLFAQENIEVVVWILAPLLFVPLVGARKLVPALPLQALYFIADVPTTGPAGGGRIVPLLAFAFVAAPFGLARLGRRSLERVLVDHRILLLLVSAAVASLLTTSVIGPYGNGWSRDREGREELRAILAAVPDDVRIRVPESIAAEVAERSRVEVLEPDDDAPVTLTAGVDALVVDEAELDELDPYQRFLLRRRIEERGFVLVERVEGLNLFVRR